MALSLSSKFAIKGAAVRVRARASRGVSEKSRANQREKCNNATSSHPPASLSRPSPFRFLYPDQVTAPSKTPRASRAAVITEAAVEKYVNPVHVDLSRQRLRASYGRKMAEQAGVKLVPIQQNTWQKIQSVTKTVFGRQEYIPTEIKFTKPSLVVGSDPSPGTVVDVCITAGGNISAAHCKFGVDGDYVTVCDMGSAAGTFLDDVKLGDDECAVLEPGMRVILDEVRAIEYEVVKLSVEEKAAAAPSIDGSSSEASLEDRLADRKAWIANYYAGNI